MANQTISQLPAAGPITGTELVPIVQNGGTYHTTTAAIANSPTLTQTFLTVQNEPTLNNSRYLSADANFSITDGGAQSFLRINLLGAPADLALAANGVIVKTSLTTVAARTLTSGTTGLSIANGDGVAGNPTFSLTGNVLSLANAAGTGMLVLTGPSAVTFRTVTGTASQIAVTDGDGVFGNPTIGLANDPTIPGSEGVTLPSGNTSARPGSPSNGVVRYNTQTSRFEGYQGGSWANFGTGDGSVTSVNLSGGATGLTVSGGPITSSGTLTLGGTPTKAVNLDNGAANEIPYQASPSTTNFITAPVSADTYLRWNGSGFVWSALAGAGTVTSVSGSGGTTGLTFSGSPITSSGTLTLGGTLVVSNGGTGATTLTGYVKGNGASTMTASATIPNTDITGLGTISTQAANNVAITGGAIDGTTIGGSTPAAGTFTSIAATSGTVSTTPSSATDIANKQYVDGLVTSGITYHTAVKYEVPNTTGNLNALYNQPGGPGVGVGATLTNNGTLAAFAPDGPTAQVGDRILVYNQTNAFENGVYEVTTVGDGSTAWVLTRTADTDSFGLKDPNSLGQGDAFFVTSGNTGKGETYECSTVGTITFGTTAINFVQISSAQVYSAGTGLNLSPSTTFNISNTGVTAAAYGSASSVATFTVNAQGQLTLAADASIAISASQVTSGTLAVAQGGTNIASYSAGDLLYASATTTISKLAIGSAGQVLTSSGTAPQYVDQSTLSVGSATTAGSATNATNAVNIGITEDTTSSATVYPVWVTANTGDLPAKVTSTKLTYVPSTGTLSTTTFNGALTGNATSATTATTATTATDANNVAVALDTTNADYYFGVYSTTTGNLPTKVVTGLTANPSTGKITGGISGGTF